MTDPHRHPSTRRPSARGARWGAVVLVGAAVLTGCSGGGGESSAGSSADLAAPEPAGGKALVAEDPAGGPGYRATDGGGRTAGGTTPVRTTQVRTAAVIRTGRVALTVKDVARTRSDVDELLAAVGGSVDDERTTTGKDGVIDRSTLVLRVPVARFDAAKRSLERLGRLRSSTESAKDVTTEVIDTAERVQTLQNSLDRLQRFQRAAADVGDLLRFEEQITRRQSELQSLQSQQSYLSGVTSRSTITLVLSTPDTATPAPGALDDAGFMAGLQAGWRTLVAAAVVALTVMGAVLPFLVAVPLVAVPAWFALRAVRRRGRRTPLPDSP